LLFQEFMTQSEHFGWSIQGIEHGREPNSIRHRAKLVTGVRSVRISVWPSDVGTVLQIME
jgi:hypothetical protein